MKTYQIKFYIFTSLIFQVGFLIQSTGFARIADFNESEVIYKKLDVKRKIQSNGGYELLYHAIIEIKKDSARTDYGLYRFQYNPNAEKLISLEAKTINGDKIHVVPKSDIIIKPIASSGPGFDTNNQVTIAYSNVNVGSKLEIKYRMKRFVSYVPGLFNDVISIGTRGLIESHTEEWTSEVPLYFELHDPQNYYELQKEEKKIRVNLKRPIFLRVIEETDSLFDPYGKVWLGITTLKNWSDFPKSTINYYENVLNSQLPRKYEEIKSIAEKIGDPYQQLNSITSQLADEIRYLGDWRSVKGAYHPRTLKKIEQTKYGDCKDFSVSLASILRKLGYEAYVAIIQRGRTNIKPPINKIPAEEFNHAIVWAMKEGKIYWIDPTNDTSFSQGIYPDIENRGALILKPSGAEYSNTPSLGFDNYVVKNNLEIQFTDDQTAQGKSKIVLEGYGSSSITGLGKFKSKAQIDMILLKWATQLTDFIEWKFPEYNLNSRVISDFTTEFQYKVNWSPIVTSSGLAYQFKSRDSIRILNIPLSKRVSSLYLPGIYSSLTNTFFVGQQFRFEKETHCSGQSVWFDYDRVMKKSRNQNQNEGILVSDKLILKKSIISHEELSSPQFFQEQKKILSCMGDYAIVFK